MESPTGMPSRRWTEQERAACLKAVEHVASQERVLAAQAVKAREFADIMHTHAFPCGWSERDSLI